MLARKVEAKDLNNIFEYPCNTIIVSVINLKDKLNPGDHIITKYSDKYSDESCQHHNGIYIGNEIVITFNRDLIASQNSIDLLEMHNGLYTKCSLSDFYNDQTYIFITNYKSDINTELHRKTVIDTAKKFLDKNYRPYILTIDNCECFAFYCWTTLQIPQDLVYELVIPEIKKYGKDAYFDNMFKNFIPYIHKP